MVKFEGKAEERELGGGREGGCKRHKERRRCSRLEEGVWGYAHIRTGVLDVKVSWVLSIIEVPYYILMVTE